MQKYLINGEDMTLHEACNKIGIVSYTTAYARVKRGWTAQDAVTLPAQEQNAIERGNKVCSCCKERKDISEYYTLGRRSGKELQPYCKECASKKTSDDLKKIREIVITHYSKGTLTCEHCTESRFDVLDLDHINGDGNKERKVFKNSRTLFKHLINSDFPLGYRVLCRNCNWMAYIERKDGFSDS